MLELGDKVVVLFPGQGSQFVGMLGEYADKFPLVKNLFAEASEVLGYDLWELTQDGPAERLNRTEFTQPALLASNYAAWQITKDLLPKQPLYMAGHSLGEYSALLAAEAIEFSAAVKLVSARGRLMQEAVPVGEGAMAAIIGLDVEQIEAVCNEAAQNQIVAPANYNSIGQTVLSGEKEAVLRAITIAKERGAKIAKLLDVSVPSHCKLMEKSAEKLLEILSGIEILTPKIKVINNVDVQSCEDPEQIKKALTRQLYSPVRWVEIVKFFSKENIESCLECGPGKVLAGLNKRIERNIRTISFSEIAKLSEQ